MTAEIGIQKAGNTCKGRVCPLCTKEGLLLLAIGFGLLLTQKNYFAYLGIAFIIFAYILPLLIKR